MSLVRPASRIEAAALTRLAVPAALGIAVAGFSLAAPAFFTAGNAGSILVNNFALLAIVSLAMTVAVTAGGIDLSVGTAVDFASLTLVSLTLAGQPVIVSVPLALLAGALVGAVNAVLISGLGISPFLATLGTLFIGRSGQQLLTEGGNPVYLPQVGVPETFTALGRGSLLGIPAPLLAVALLAAVLLVLGRTRFGRGALAVGVQPGVALYSGLPVGRLVAGAYILVGAAAALGGIVLSATVNVYVPGSGNAFLLNAVGATFIGTTLSRFARPNVGGTLLGVLLLAVIANGLLLTGISFYWQQVATGLVILLVLAASARRTG